MISFLYDLWMKANKVAVFFTIMMLKNNVTMCWKVETYGRIIIVALYWCLSFSFRIVRVAFINNID